jgi:hypothetical protein
MTDNNDHEVDEKIANGENGEEEEEGKEGEEVTDLSNR